MPLSINQIPTPVPSSTDPANFSARGDAVFGAFPNFITQTNAVASEAAANRDLTEASKISAANSETNAATYAANATTSANNASSSSIASLWVSGTTYAVNDKRVSPITGQVYRRKVAGAGTTDPSLDSTNWYAVLLDADTQYPTIKPTLNLDFANAGKLDPRITFTRASIGTYFDKLGVLRTASNNEPRFDYDPLTLEAKGLLIEESRQNLLTYSEQFENAAWSKTAVTITANAITAPNGTVTAEKLIASTAASQHFVSYSDIPSGTYTWSVFMKAGELTRGAISCFDGSYKVGTIFDLASGVVVSQQVGSISSIQNAGNGWYRCSVTATLAAASQFGGCQIRPNLGGAYPSEATAGDGTSGIYIWGAQLEQGAFPTSYIATTATTSTRQADLAVMTGTNFSSWYNQSEGTIYSEVETYRNQGSSAPFLASDGTISNCVATFPDAQYHLYVRTSNTIQANLDAGAYVVNKFTKNAAYYSLNNFAVSLDSGVVATDLSGTPPVVNRLYIGSNENGSLSMSGHIKKLTYFPRKVSDYQLQILTK